MQSRFDPELRYEELRTLAPHDYDVEADAWVYDGREVFRGSRDPRYPTLHVHWLYDELSQRVGVAEHDPRDKSKFNVLWYYDCPFATFLQEDGWTTADETLWTRMPSHVYEYCMQMKLTGVQDIQTLCMRGDWRIVTPHDLPLKTVGFPDVFKVLFVDDDCTIYVPPPESRIWSTLPLASDGSRGPTRPQLPVQASAQDASQTQEREPDPDHPGTQQPR